MVTTLALFFYFNNLAQPSPAQRNELRRWFWATAVCQRYAGSGFRKNILQDVGFFKKLARRNGAKFKIEPHERLPTSDLLRADYSRRSGLSDGFFCMLALQEPRFVKSGGLMLRDLYSSRANRKDKHHIFPRDLLRRDGFARRDWNSICNVCFLAAEENQSFGSKSPAVYLKNYKKHKFFGKVMKSHLIPHSANSSLWSTRIKRDYKIFLKERMKLIASKFEDLAGMKLFRSD